MLNFWIDVNNYIESDEWFLKFWYNESKRIGVAYEDDEGRIEEMKPKWTVIFTTRRDEVSYVKTNFSEKK